MYKLVHLITITLLISSIGYSCSKNEDVSGCTDPAGSNYNPSATVSDGSCRFLRDEFIGNYNVMFSGCDKNAFFDNLTITIDADAKNSTDVSVVLNNVYVKLLIFKGTVSNNGLSINSSYDAFVSRAEEAFVYNGIVYLFPTFNLLGSLTKSNDTLNGQLTLSVVNGDANNSAIANVRCQYTLTKN
jgi:hypothetical protein